MATILMTWELGAGLGHLVRLQPVASGLVRAGHRVYAAIRDLSRAHRVFGQGLVSLLQAPVQIRPTSGQIALPMTFPHFLHNFGFSNPSEISERVEAWRNLYQFVRPDLILFDHSPTALLAARGFPARLVLIGSGFFCPPDSHPMPNLRTWATPDLEALRLDEQRVLSAMNQALDAFKAPQLSHVARLYAEVDDTLLTTFAELDHYRTRPNAHYWGAWTRFAGGKAPQWPRDGGRRVYAYLKSFNGLPDVLQVLSDMNNSTLIFADGISEGIQRRFTSASLRFENQPLDLAQIGRECDLAILNGNHGTTISLLMQGRPTIQLPISLEQALFSLVVQDMGAGLGAAFDKPEQVRFKLRQMLGSSSFAAAAHRFAEKYASFDSDAMMQALLARIEEVLTRP